MSVNSPPTVPLNVMTPDSSRTVAESHGPTRNEIARISSHETKSAEV